MWVLVRRKLAMYLVHFFYAVSITVISTPTAEVVMSVCYVVVKAATM